MSLPSERILGPLARRVNTVSRWPGLFLRSLPSQAFQPLGANLPTEVLLTLAPAAAFVHGHPAFGSGACYIPRPSPMHPRRWRGFGGPDSGLLLPAYFPRHLEASLVSRGSEMGAGVFRQQTGPGLHPWGVRDPLPQPSAGGHRALGERRWCEQSWSRSWVSTRASGHRETRWSAATLNCLASPCTPGPRKWVRTSFLLSQ